MTRVLAVLKEPERSMLALERLADRFAGVEVDVASDVAAARAFIARADVLITIGSVLGADAEALLLQAARLQWIQSIGVGVDNLLGHPALAAHVVVTNIRGVHGEQMSEAALAAMLVLARDVPRLLRNQAAARWERFAPSLLSGSTVGILGLGAIAGALAPRCKALGMTVIGISSTPRQAAGFDRVESRDDLTHAVAALDYLVVLTPYSQATHHLVDARVLASMKPSARLINLARGGVLDEQALLDALDRGAIAGAALDVFSEEPLPPAHRLWSHPKIVVTPHLGGLHEHYAEQTFSVIENNLSRYLQSGSSALINRLN